MSIDLVSFFTFNSLYVVLGNLLSKNRDDTLWNQEKQLRFLLIYSQMQGTTM